MKDEILSVVFGVITFALVAAGFICCVLIVTIPKSYVGCEPVDVFSERVTSCEGRGCDNMGPKTTISYLCTGGKLKTKVVSGVFTLEQIIQNQEAERPAIEKLEEAAEIYALVMEQETVQRINVDEYIYPGRRINVDECIYQGRPCYDFTEDSFVEYTDEDSTF